MFYVISGKSFKYKTKIVGNTPERPGNEGDANRPPVPTLNVEVTIPLKYLSHFGGFLDLPLINWEIKDEANNFNNNLANTNNFKSFKYKVKLLENTLLMQQMEF